jgi:hypothetical protein
MTRCVSLATLAAILACGWGVGPASAQTPDTKGKACRMEQQCRWENFKKICTYVKVCR